MQLIPKLLAATILALPLIANATATDLNDIFSATGYVDAEGRDWVPSGEFTLGSADTWSVLTSQCNAVTGSCGNQPNSPQWATTSQVEQLFGEITGLPTSGLSNNGTAAIAIQSVLGDTFAEGGVSEYSGVTRDGSLFNVAVGYNLSNTELTGAGGLSISSCYPNPTVTCSDESFTGFIYYPSAVPVPASLGLMALGLAGIGFVLGRPRAERHGVR